MSCRCSDIEQEKGKYNRLLTQAKRLEKHAGYQEELEQKVIDMKTYLNNGMGDAVPYGLYSKLQMITDELEPLRSRINRKISQKIEDVQSNIASMRSEDSAWHEEQERIAQEQKRLEEAMRLQQSGGTQCLK